MDLSACFDKTFAQIAKRVYAQIAKRVYAQIAK
jgi:hypothetical protein